jgi:hypothetical protein
MDEEADDDDASAAPNATPPPPPPPPAPPPLLRFTVSARVMSVSCAGVSGLCARLFVSKILHLRQNLRN